MVGVSEEPCPRVEEQRVPSHAPPDGLSALQVAPAGGGESGEAVSRGGERVGLREERGTGARRGQHQQRQDRVVEVRARGRVEADGRAQIEVVFYR